jgi:predicted membrane channel-forming protein YqfA (hemolysin III family)
MNNIVTTEGVVKRTKKIQETQDQRNEKYYSWLKNLITISIALFGLIISFKSGKSKTELESLFFIISIFSLGLGILFALLTLFGEVRVLGLLKKKYSDLVISYLDGDSKEVELENVEVPFLYKASSLLYVIFYLISLVTLILYSTIEEIKTVYNAV